MTLEKCAAFLTEHDDFVILTHARPDGDAVGSACALCAALRRMGKQAVVYKNPEITEKYMRFAVPYLAVTQKIRHESTVISVDLAAENMFPQGFSGEVEFSIDHHPADRTFAKHTYSNPDKASCGEIILQLVKMLCGNVTREEAELLYVAVSTDTGCFTYGNTHSDTLRAGAELLDYGVQNAPLNVYLFRTKTFPRIRLEGEIYNSIRSYYNHRVNIAVVTLDMMAQAGAREDDCDDLANLVGQVSGNLIGITIREISEGKSKVSVRTNASCDASAICRSFGGGGHKMAAGCTADFTPEQFAEKLIEVVDGLYGEQWNKEDENARRLYHL